MKAQNLQNHSRYVPLYHFVSSTLLLAVLIGSFVNLYHSTSETHYSAALIVALTISVIFVWYFVRVFALKAQVMPLKDKITSLQLIIDKSSVEILLNNGKYSMTNLMFPTEDYTNLNIITKDNTSITNLKLNTIARVWDIQN